MKFEEGKLKYRRADKNDIQILVDSRMIFLIKFFGRSDDIETSAVRESLKIYFKEAVPSNNFIAWLAEYDNKIIGISGMVVWKIPAKYGLRSGKVGYILNMYTIPELRRKGICTRLLNELIGEARAMGLDYLHLHSSRDGMNIYRKAGFVEPSQVELGLKLK